MPLTLEFMLDLAGKLRQGVDIENCKLDIKAEWYDLSKPGGQAELSKDIAALANTPGPAGHLIIGLSKQGVFADSPFARSNLPDKSDLRKLVVKRVELPPEFELHEIPVTENGTTYLMSVIEVPPSLEKPHFVKKDGNIENFIPIRKTTGTWPAGRSDVEHMYYDRKNVLVDYRLDGLIYSKSPVFNCSGPQAGITTLQVDVRVYLRNTGLRPTAIQSATLTFEYLSFAASITEATRNALPKEMVAQAWRDAGANGRPFIEPLLMDGNEAKCVNLAFTTSFDNNGLAGNVNGALTYRIEYRFKIDLFTVFEQTISLEPRHVLITEN